jgi:lysylphosphatidylglycerol synthetase-like protein (DUF2156 family)
MKPSAWRVLAVLVGLVLFAVLMGLRPELGSRWARSLVAGAAFAVLGLALLYPKARK